MKILFLIHSFLSDTAKHGVAILSYEIAKELSEKHEVVVAERQYYDGDGAQYKLTRDDYRGIKKYIITSPSPPKYNIVNRYPKDQKLLDVLDQLISMEQCIDIVNIHHLAMWPIDTAEYIRSKNIASVLSIHDTWYICPAISYFNQIHQITCSKQIRTSPDECAGCLRKLTSERFKADINLDWFTTNKLLSVDSYLGLFSNVDAIIFPSSKNLAHYQGEGIIHPNSHIIPSFIRAPQINNRRNHTGYVIGTLSNVCLGKGIETVIDAMSLIHNHDIKLKIYGAILDKFLESKIEQTLKKDGRIEYCGTYDLDNLGDILGGLDAVVIPSSITESFNLCSYLSVSAGMRVIVSDMAYHTEFLTDGANCAVFDSQNPHDLASKITQSYDIKRPTITPLARNENFLGHRYDDVYQSVLQDRNSFLDCRLLYIVNVPEDVFGMNNFMFNFYDITVLHNLDDDSVISNLFRDKAKYQFEIRKSTQLNHIIDTISTSSKDIVIKYGPTLIKAQTLRRTYKTEFANTNIIRANVDSNGRFVTNKTGLTFVRQGLAPELIEQLSQEIVS